MGCNYTSPCLKGLSILSNFKRASSVFLFILLASAVTGVAQEKKQPKKKQQKKEPTVVASIISEPLYAEQQPAAWKKFTAETGGFSILFPGTPQEASQKIQIGGYEVPVRMLTFESLASYTVLYLDSPTGINPNSEATQKLLDSSAKQALKTYQATTLQEKAVTLDGYPGVSYVLRLPDGFGMRLRVYAVRGRLFQLTIVTPSEHSATADQRSFYEATANKFLDSFTLAPYTPPAIPRIADGGLVRAEDDDAPPAPPAPKTLPRAPIQGGILNGKAISKPQPPYPDAARQSRASGTVQVGVVINEEGRVIEAEALSGPEELRAAAVEAARKARFPPTRLSGQPVKIAGRLTYNFVLP